jgi:hypothetical protein
MTSMWSRRSVRSMMSTMWRLAPVLAVVLGACKTEAPAMVDAVAVAPPCTGAFTGNFTATATMADCATQAAGVLQLAMPSTTLATTFQIAIDLGATPSTGMYAPGIVATWSASASATVGNAQCVYSAGNAAVPSGSFSLTVDDAEAPHGKLDLLLYVLMPPFTDCGPQMTESMTLTF